MRTNISIGMLILLGVIFGLGGCVENPFLQKDVALYNRGVELVNADEDLEAAELFKKVLEIDPQHPLANYNLGVIYDDRGMFEEAIVEFRKAIEINPKNLDAHYRLGVAYATQGMDEEAIAELQIVLESEPAHVPSLYNLAVLREKLGQEDQAVEYYRKVVQLKPDDAQALNNLGLACAKKGMWDAAQEYLQKAIDVKPRYLEAMNNLGIVLVHKKSYEQAASMFQKVLKQNPKSLQALFNLAKLNFENTRDYRAVQEYTQAYLACTDEGGHREERKEMEDLLAQALKELGSLQKQADASVQSRIRKDAREFILAVQRADFRGFYDVQPPELRDVLTKEEWDRDMLEMDPANQIEQKEALTKIIGFKDLLTVDVKAVELVSAHKAKVVLAGGEDSGPEIRQKESYWEEVNGKWVPSVFLQRIQDNWARAKMKI